MSETYGQEAKVIIDPITCEIPTIEVKTHQVSLHAFEALETIHPTGCYKQWNGGIFYFNVFYGTIEFTWFCAERFEA